MANNSNNYNKNNSSGHLARPLLLIQPGSLRICENVRYVHERLLLSLQLPDKSMASLVRFYYSWKKSRSKTSLMDRQTRKHKRDRDDR